MVCCFNMFSPCFLFYFSPFNCFVCTDINFLSLQFCYYILQDFNVFFFLSKCSLYSYIDAYLPSLFERVYFVILIYTVFSSCSVSICVSSCDNLSMLALVLLSLLLFLLEIICFIFFKNVSGILNTIQENLLWEFSTQCIRNEPMIYSHNTLTYL